MTSDRDRTAGSPSGALGVVLGVALLMILGFVAYFILPKVEVYYASIALRPPFALECLIGASHRVFRYSWILVAAGLAVFLLNRSPARRGDRSIS
jgi:type II secretory pathway component PulF